MDETTDIRIASVGIDLVVGAGSARPWLAAPALCDLRARDPGQVDLVGGGELDFDFLPRKRRAAADRRHHSRAASLAGVAGVDRPDWKGQDEAKASGASAARPDLAEIRTKAYAAHGIKLLLGEPEREPAMAPADTP